MLSTYYREDVLMTTKGIQKWDSRLNPMNPSSCTGMGTLTDIFRDYLLGSNLSAYII